MMDKEMGRRTQTIPKKKQKLNDQQLLEETLVDPTVLSSDVSYLAKRKHEESDDNNDDDEEEEREEEDAYEDKISVKQLPSNDVVELTSYFRKLLSGKNPPIQQVIDCGVVPCLVRFLLVDDNPALQLEAAGAIAGITNSDRSDHVGYLIEADVVSILIRLLSSPNDYVRALVAEALGNIGANKVEYRDILLAAGTLPALMHAINDCKEQPRVIVVREIARALSKLCCGKPAPDLLTIEPALSVLAGLLSSQNVETVEEACCVFNEVSSRGEIGIRVIFQLGIVQQLVKLLNNAATKILSPVIKTLTHITQGNTSQLQLIMSYNILPCLLKSLNHGVKEIRKDACRVISNIIARDQIQPVIDAGIFPKVIELMRASEDNIQKEATRAVYNTILQGTHSHIWYLIGENVLPALCCSFQAHNKEVVQLALEGLKKMLHVNLYQSIDKLETIVMEICACDGMNALKSSRSHQDRGISTCANNIIELAFGTHLISDNPESSLVSIQYYNKILRTVDNPPIRQL